MIHDEYTRGKSVWVSFHHLAALTGLTQNQIRQAIACGIVRIGRDYVDRQRRFRVFRLDRMLLLAPAIRENAICGSAEATARRHGETTMRLTTISTKAKMHIAAVIKRCHQLECDALDHARRCAAMRHKMEEQYHYILWEKKDCPHCEGRGHPRDDEWEECPHCADYEAVEDALVSTFGPSSSSAADSGDDHPPETPPENPAESAP